MSETTNLKLFKHDNPATNENQFDVTKALNNNWEKIDDFAETTNTKITENQNNIKSLQTDNTTNKKDIATLKSDNTTNKQDIANLKTENEELKAENERLRQDMNAYPSNTAEGEYITLTDSADSRFNKFNIIGKSTQKTREGYNLLNVDKNFKVIELTSIMNLDLKAGKYTIQFDNVETNNDSVISYVCVFMKDNTPISYLHINKTDKKNVFTLNSDTNQFRIWSADSSDESVGVTTTYINLMIYEGTDEKKYEEYGISPSPNFSSRIRNVGDNVNHFNKSTIKTGYYLDNTGAEIANINYAITDYMKVEENENYVYQGLNIEASFASKGAYYNSNKKFVNYFDLNAKNTLMKIPENVKYVRFTLRLPNNNQDTFKFEKGTIASLYSPYNCGNVEIDINNNNLGNTDILASLKNSAVTINSKSSFTIDLSKGNVSAFQNIDLLFGKNDKNKRYTLSYHLHQNNDSFRPGFAIIYSDGTKTSGGNSGDTDVDVTLNSTEGKTIERISIGWNTQTGGGIVTFSDIYLRLSDDTSEFQEQEKQEFVFPLSEGQKLYEGSYLANDGIHHNRKQRKMVLSEFNISVLYEDEGICSLMNKSGFSWDYININGMCSHFKNAKNTNIVDNFSAKTYLNDNEFNFRNASNGKDRLYFKNSAFTTLEQWQDFFNNNDVIVEYECEEYVEAYTDEQKQVYDEIVKTAKTYKTVTNIFSTNEVSPKFEVNYRRDIDTYIDNKLANVNEQILNIAGGN